MPDSKQVKTSYYFRDESHRKQVQSWLVQNDLKFQRFVEQSLDAALSGAQAASTAQYSEAAETVQTASGYSPLEAEYMGKLLRIMRASDADLRADAWNAVSRNIDVFEKFAWNHSVPSDVPARNPAIQLDAPRDRGPAGPAVKHSATTGDLPKKKRRSS